jgi:hypothetical protein
MDGDCKKRMHQKRNHYRRHAIAVNWYPVETANDRHGRNFPAENDGWRSFFLIMVFKVP